MSAPVDARCDKGTCCALALSGSRVPCSRDCRCCISCKMTEFAQQVEPTGATISVALCTYNGAKHIGLQLESLATQTYPPVELVVCDDGSTDDTLAIVAAFAENAPFPVSIHRNTTKLGYANNFLHAASLCSGLLVAFSDQDDVWAESKLGSCVAFFEDPEVLLAVHAAEVWNGQQKMGALLSRLPPDRSTPGVDPESIPPGARLCGCCAPLPNCTNEQQRAARGTSFRSEKPLNRWHMTNGSGFWRPPSARWLPLRNPRCFTDNTRRT